MDHKKLSSKENRKRLKTTASFFLSCVKKSLNHVILQGSQRRDLDGHFFSSSRHWVWTQELCCSILKSLLLPHSNGGFGNGLTLTHRACDDFTHTGLIFCEGILRITKRLLALMIILQQMQREFWDKSRHKRRQKWTNWHRFAFWKSLNMTFFFQSFLRTFGIFDQSAGFFLSDVDL